MKTQLRKIEDEYCRYVTSSILHRKTAGEPNLKTESPEYYLHHRREKIIGELQEIRELVTPLQFLGIARYIWTKYELNLSDAEAIFSILSSADRRLLMTSQELEIFDSLPASFTIYRGAKLKSNILGKSWTTSKEVGWKFATKYAGYEGGEAMGVFLRAKCSKSDVVAFFQEEGVDDELEIVIAPSKLKAVMQKPARDEKVYGRESWTSLDARESKSEENL